MKEKKIDEKVVSDDELIEDVSSDDDAPVEIIYRCKNCGQILSSDAKDCWKCASKDIERVVEEETKELKKVMLQARIDKLENDIKKMKSNYSFLYILIGVIIVVMTIYIISNR